ncbi:MAG: exodeoxyribonuclease VII large subunit [bacterium]
MAAIPAKRVFSISEVNRLVAGMLDEHFSDIWVMGEVSNFKAYPSGHLYFALKDEESQIQAVCFRDSARRLKFTLEDGLLIVGHGRLEVYVPNGKYQIILDTIEPRGLGALQKAFEQLKRKLEQEGLFKEERKRPLPKLPRVIGIVTSPAGAAIHDMLKTLRLHKAHLKVILYPVQVQGEGAAEQIAAAIAGLNMRDDVEVIIVGRGGGSLEDLWSFNEEIVARAIAASRVPVITGIGHEVDFTIADFVADVRAATPTAAAQIVAQGWRELEEQFRQVIIDLRNVMQEWLFEREQRVEELSRHRAFELVSRRLGEARYQAEIFEQGIINKIKERLNMLNSGLHHLTVRINRQSPVAKIKGWQVQLGSLNSRMERSITMLKSSFDVKLESLAASLNALSPLSSLARGYSICLRPDGGVVKSLSQVDIGEPVVVRVEDGKLGCEVKEKIKGDGNGK